MLSCLGHLELEQEQQQQRPHDVELLLDCQAPAVRERRGCGGRFEVRNVVEYLPFQSIYNAPLSILLEKEKEFEDVARVIGLQFVWCVALIILGKLFWKVSIRQITVNGG